MSGDIYVIHLIHRGYYGLFDVKWNWMDEKSSTSKKNTFIFGFRSNNANTNRRWEKSSKIELVRW